MFRLEKGNLRQLMRVSPFGLAVKRLRLVSRRTTVRFRICSPFSSEAVVCGHIVVTLALTMNETLKWVSPLSILMQNQSGGARVALGIIPSPAFPPHTSLDLGPRQYLVEDKSVLLMFYQAH